MRIHFSFWYYTNTLVVLVLYEYTFRFGTIRIHFSFWYYTPATSPHTSTHKHKHKHANARRNKHNRHNATQNAMVRNQRLWRFFRLLMVWSGRGNFGRVIPRSCVCELVPSATQRLLVNGAEAAAINGKPSLHAARKTYLKPKDCITAGRQRTQ